MSDGEGDLVADMKRIRGEITEMHVAFLSTLTGRSDPYVMHKEFIAMRAEMRQMKADWQAEIREMKAEREAERIAWQNERETQEAYYKKVCDELEAMKLKQKRDRDRISALRLEAAEMKKKQEAQDVKVSDELAALKLKQTRDATAIRAETAEMKKKQEAQDVKLQNHEKELSIRLVDPVQSFIAGKWKLASSTGREEYEKLIDGDSYAKKISYDNRYFTYSGGSLSSYVGPNNDTPDPAYTKEYYTVNNRKLIFNHNRYVSLSDIFQWINIWIENSQLIVQATIYEKSDVTKGIATCKCIYNRA